MKLYKIPPQSYIRLEDGEILFFDHVDGAYSFCTDKDNNVIHLSASTEVDKVYENNKNKA